MNIINKIKEINKVLDKVQMKPAEWQEFESELYYLFKSYFKVDGEKLLKFLDRNKAV